MAERGLMRSAHDCSEGGLACALVEAAIGGQEGPHGFDIALDDAIAPVALFFGETQGRVVLTCTPADAPAILTIATEHGVPAKAIGTVGPPGGTMSLRSPRGTVRVDAAEAARIHGEALPKWMETDAP
jgi:phosphoribosylformylglycinamidine synthase